MDTKLREFVRERAGGCCEYCHLPQEATPLVPFHVEHIIPRQHGGSDHPDHLALSCDRCNVYKGPNLTSIDPASGEIVRLFHPREDAWTEHFESREGKIGGRTPTGRATVELLNMNAVHRVRLRELWLS